MPSKPSPTNPPAFGDDDDEKTEHSNPGDLPFTPRSLDDDDEKTQHSNPGDLPFTPRTLTDEDDEETVLVRPVPKKR